MKSCRLSFCTMQSSHASGLCPIHATTWLLTPGARKTGDAYERALAEYVTRQEVRNHLAKQRPPDTRPKCRCSQPALDSGTCASCVADAVL